MSGFVLSFLIRFYKASTFCSVQNWQLFSVNVLLYAFENISNVAIACQK